MNLTAAVRSTLVDAFNRPREVANKTPTLEQIKAIEKGIRENSIAALVPLEEMPAKHYFADGIYGRELFRPAGAFIIGKMHAKSGLYVLAQGELTVWNDSGSQRISAPHVLVTKAGTKRMSYAHTDATVIVFHATNEIELDKVEAELIIPDIAEIEAERLAAIELEKQT
jgi:hypothetical protein